MDELKKKAQLYYQENKDELKAKARIYYQRNKEEIAKRHKEYHQKNKKEKEEEKSFLEDYPFTLVFK
jgi:hypothetical protein